MVADEKYCVDLLLRISAVQGADEQVSKILMTRHTEGCIRDSPSAGGERGRSQRINELVRVLTRHRDFSGR